MERGKSAWGRREVGRVTAFWALQLLLVAGTIPVVLDAHEQLLVRGTNMMTAEDRAITLGLLVGAYWCVLAVVWLAARLAAARASLPVALGLGALSLLAGWVGVVWAPDALFLALHEACYAARWCDSQPVFAHAMYTLSATTGRPGIMAFVVLPFFVALALARGRRVHDPVPHHGR